MATRAEIIEQQTEALEALALEVGGAEALVQVRKHLQTQDAIKRFNAYRATLLPMEGSFNAPNMDVKQQRAAMVAALRQVMPGTTLTVEQAARALEIARTLIKQVTV